MPHPAITAAATQSAAARHSADPTARPGRLLLCMLRSIDGCDLAVPWLVAGSAAAIAAGPEICQLETSLRR